jgi:hypothetical protein
VAENGEGKCSYHLRLEREQAEPPEPNVEPELVIEEAEAEPISQKPKRRVENVRAELAKDSQDAYEVIRAHCSTPSLRRRKATSAAPTARSDTPWRFRTGTAV